MLAREYIDPSREKDVSRDRVENQRASTGENFLARCQITTSPLSIANKKFLENLQNLTYAIP